MRILKEIVRRPDDTQGSFEARIRRRISWSAALSFVVSVVVITEASLNFLGVGVVVEVLLLALLLALVALILNQVYVPARFQLNAEKRKKKAVV